MHYYDFNVADYRKDTHHLEPLEHYIYRFLMDSYYLNEKPIPNETQSVLRRLRLGSDHLKLLENVLNDFFYLADDGWHHKRIDSEIEAYQARCAKNAKNGKKGGRPKKQQLSAENKPKKTQSVSDGLPDESQKKPNQEPRTNNQEPIKKNIHADLAEKLNVDVGLVERVVRHRREIKHPANTDKKITLVVKDLASCVDQGFFESLDQAMDRLDETEWRTLKPEYLEEKGNAKNKRTYPQCGTRSFEQIDYGAGVNADGTF